MVVVECISELRRRHLARVHSRLATYGIWVIVFYRDVFWPRDILVSAPFAEGSREESK